MILRIGNSKCGLRLAVCGLRRISDTSGYRKPKTENRKPKSAFTLIELLVAVTVIAVGMVFVLGALSQCIYALTTAQKTARANYLLSEKIWSIDQERQAVGGSEEGAWSGAFAAPCADYQWADEVRAINEDFGNETTFIRKYLNEETMKVIWRQGKTDKDVSVTRYVARKQS